MEENPNTISSVSNVSSTSLVKKKKHGWMFDYIINVVDKVFQVHDGEPVGTNKPRRLNSSENILEEEVIFCKNNVCVHDITNVSEDEHFSEKHLPGYMSIKKIYRADNAVSDLILSWTPNSLLAHGTTEEAELLSSSGGPDSNGYDGDSNSACESPRSENSSLEECNAIKLEESLCIQNFETPLGNVFSINVIDAKTVKLFYGNSGKDMGQFVICSKENEYKVFHFHNVGLLKLTEIFDLWNGCICDNDVDADEDGQRVYYIANNIKQSSEDGRDIHPEEGRYKPMNMNQWLSSVNHLGQIEDGFNFRKHVFFGGLSQEVRPDAWKYLLYHYPMQSTLKDQEILKEQKRKLYENIQKKRLSLSGEEYQIFWKKIQFIVDKDVVRTDRSHPYFAGQQNPNLDKMGNILLNYAHYNPDIGYTQGMSDLLAPLLVTLHDESDSFWCFVGLMEFSMFATTPTDKSMDKSLGFLRELLRIMAPEFYMHCLCNDMDLNLLFAHRWLVLCFKREFIFHEVLKIWETCWARYQTDYFHIFICVAMVTVYGTVCLEKNMDAVEILQYFTDMSMKFDGSAVLTEARSLLYKFRQLHRLPCSLRGLLSGKGVWDGGIRPEIECVSRYKTCCLDYGKQSSGPLQHQATSAGGSGENGIDGKESGQSEGNGICSECEIKDDSIGTCESPLVDGVLQLLENNQINVENIDNDHSNDELGENTCSSTEQVEEKFISPVESTIEKCDTKLSKENFNLHASTSEKVETKLSTANVINVDANCTSEKVENEMSTENVNYVDTASCTSEKGDTESCAENVSNVDTASCTSKKGDNALSTENVNNVDASCTSEKVETELSTENVNNIDTASCTSEKSDTEFNMENANNVDASCTSHKGDAELSMEDVNNVEADTELITENVNNLDASCTSEKGDTALSTENVINVDASCTSEKVETELSMENVNNVDTEFSMENVNNADASYTSDKGDTELSTEDVNNVEVETELITENVNNVDASCASEKVENEVSVENVNNVDAASCSSEKSETEFSVENVNNMGASCTSDKDDTELSTEDVNNVEVETELITENVNNIDTGSEKEDTALSTGNEDNVDAGNTSEGDNTSSTENVNNIDASCTSEIGDTELSTEIINNVDVSCTSEINDTELSTENVNNIDASCRFEVGDVCKSEKSDIELNEENININSSTSGNCDTELNRENLNNLNTCATKNEDTNTSEGDIESSGENANSINTQEEILHTPSTEESKDNEIVPAEEFFDANVY